MTTELGIRDLLDRWAAWLLRGVTGKLLYVIALHFDFLVHWAQVAIWSRYPGFYSYETLPLHARARRIRQGIGESNRDYALRLARYLEPHETWGGPYALLEQLWEQYRHSPDGAFRIHLVYQSGAYFLLDTDGTITRPPFVFSTGSDDWAHWWLVFEWPEPIADDGTWDDPGDWDDPDGAWDTSMPFSQVAAIRLIPAEWNNAHCIGHIILLGPGQAVWDIPDEDWNSEEEWDEGGDDELVEIIVN